MKNPLQTETIDLCKSFCQFKNVLFNNICKEKCRKLIIGVKKKIFLKLITIFHLTLTFIRVNACYECAHKFLFEAKVIYDKKVINTINGRGWMGKCDVVLRESELLKRIL